MTDGRSSEYTKRILIALIIISAAAAFIFLDIKETFRSALLWIENQGNVGIAAFCAIYILACVLLIPGSILTLGAGAIFGVLRGSIIVSLASTTGAAAAFFAGRYLAREWVSGKVIGNARFAAIDNAVADEGWKIVGLTRLSPVFPFNLLNYAFGLTKVKPVEYIAASWIGMMPGTVMYVYMGSLAGDLATLGTGSTEKTPAQWVLTIVGFIATVLVTALITRKARKALSGRLMDEEDGS
jgi:uncharacterized membrane protein YdjX (TVP38/TMEM64 family)